jgi:hypothetical protein
LAERSLRERALGWLWLEDARNGREPYGGAGWAVAEVDDFDGEGVDVNVWNGADPRDGSVQNEDRRCRPVVALILRVTGGGGTVCGVALLGAGRR